MTCQNLQNKLLNITVLFIWYLLQIVGEFKKNVTRQTLFHFGEYLFQSTRHFGECLKNIWLLAPIDIPPIRPDYRCTEIVKYY
jgi:hypothetical protein